MPSSSVATASPSIAKSWKSMLDASMKRCRSGPRPAGTLAVSPRPRARGIEAPSRWDQSLGSQGDVRGSLANLSGSMATQFAVEELWSPPGIGLRPVRSCREKGSPPPFCRSSRIKAIDGAARHDVRRVQCGSGRRPRRMVPRRRRPLRRDSWFAAARIVHRRRPTRRRGLTLFSKYRVGQSRCFWLCRALVHVGPQSVVDRCAHHRREFLLHRVNDARLADEGRR